MYPHASSLIILKQVDSTNNYAMASVHEGMANHGDAVFSHQQTNGKGQRGKVWQTGDRENIALSVILRPTQLKIQYHFQLSVAIALAVCDVFALYAGDETYIKWPNDIYWRDRKAGGILIENVISGTAWKWAVAGIGLNINQTVFEGDITNAVSLKQIIGKDYDTEALAKELHEGVMSRTSELLTKPYPLMLDEYQQRLYKIGNNVRLKKGNAVFETTIRGVSAQGQLLTRDVIDKQFEFGEVEWVL